MRLVELAVCRDARAVHVPGGPARGPGPSRSREHRTARPLTCPRQGHARSRPAPAGAEAHTGGPAAGPIGKMLNSRLGCRWLHPGPRDRLRRSRGHAGRGRRKRGPCCWVHITEGIDISEMASAVPIAGGWRPRSRRPAMRLVEVSGCRDAVLFTSRGPRVGRERPQEHRTARPMLAALHHAHRGALGGKRTRPPAGPPQRPPQGMSALDGHNPMGASVMAGLRSLILNAYSPSGSQRLPRACLYRFGLV